MSLYEEGVLDLDSLCSLTTKGADVLPRAIGGESEDSPRSLVSNSSPLLSLPELLITLIKLKLVRERHRLSNAFQRTGSDENLEGSASRHQRDLSGDWNASDTFP